MHCCVFVSELNQLLSAEMLVSDILAERARRRRAYGSDAALDAVISKVVARRLASIERGEPVPLDAAEVRS